MRRLQRIVGSVVASLVAAVAVACTTFTADDPAPTSEGGGPDAAAETSDLPLEAGADAADAADAARPLPGKRVMFLTNATYTGNLGGIAGANEKCNAAAMVNPALMKATFGAWISTGGSSAAKRFAKDARPIVAPNGDSLAPAGWPDLARVPHSSKILSDENGTLVTANFVVWTGTAANGDDLPGGSSSCSDWTTDSGMGVAGDADKLTEAWTNDAARVCSTSGRLYCLEL